ncbi:MAG: trehalose 6-phosphate phosphatase [Thermoleophilaceae bacterium]|nr:trehalose 6-phosphate phosphatase [Thermoleophilaceae bacterium]
MAAPTADILAEALRPLTEAPERAAVLCDIDGTLAPIVQRAEEARVPPEATRALAALASRYAVVACVSGRSAMDARRLVGVGGIAYAGAHGAELLMPGDRKATILPEFADYAEPVHRFVAGLDDDALRAMGIRVEDKGPIVGLHWRGADDEEAAQSWLQGIAGRVDGDGLATHWGRKVLEVRPPIPVTKARAVEELVARPDVRSALYAGDDTTDLDAFDALDSLVAAGRLDAAVRVGVESEEGPAAIVERADLVVKGTGGVQAVLSTLAEA